MSITRSTSDDRLRQLFVIMKEELNEKDPTSACKAYAIDRQVQRMRKRASFNARDLEPRAIADFVSINTLVGLTRVSLAEPLIVEAARYIQYVLERFTTSFDETNIQQTLDPTYLYDNWRFGPGTSNGVRGTHTAEKIIQPMSCTLLCKPFVQILRQGTYFRLFDESSGTDGTTIVKGSRLSTVPKNEDTLRTIAIEPLGNMAMQLAAGKYLEGALRMSGLDITKQQPLNKAMAKRGSVDGSFCTIDLKSASDMIQPFLVRKLFPQRWYKLLTAIRSEYIDIGDGEALKLNMISTMGNGYTFPLMTLIITSLIYAYRRMHGGPNLFIDWNSTCVFGDDIIVRNNEYAGVCEVLRAAGLIVNSDKSYASGPFRESCGGDYYEGYDVTPFYIESIATDSEVYIAINKVFSWCSRHNCLLSRTLLYLKSCLTKKVLFIPMWHNPDEGFLTPVVERRYTYLLPCPIKVDHKSGPFDMMLAVGGYLTPVEGERQFGSGNFYIPRQNKTRYKARKSRLPNGFLDGSDPIKGVSNDYISSLSFLMM